MSDSGSAMGAAVIAPLRTLRTATSSLPRLAGEALGEGLAVSTDSGQLSFGSVAA